MVSRRSRRVLRIIAIVFAALVALLVLLWLLFDPNWLKDPIESRVQQATGRAFHIGGDVDLRFGLPLTLSVERVRLGNVDWSEEPIMLRIDRVDLRLWPWQALRGRWNVQRATLHQPWLLLERNADRDDNWSSLVGGESGGDSRLRIDRLLLDDGELQFRDAALDTDVTVHLTSDAAAGDGESGADALAVRGEGRYRGAPFSIQGAVESLLALRSDARAYRVDLSARAGATSASVRGELDLQLPGPFDDMDVELTLRGDNLADLERLLDMALPETPPYAFSGRLLRAETVWEYTGFDGTLGDSDIGGDVRIEHGDERTLLQATLHSKLLNIDDLAGVLGGVPEPDGTVNEAQRREAQRRAALGRIFPDRPIAKGMLRKIDADIRMTAKNIQPRRWPLESMKVEVTARNGRVEVDPMHFASAGGSIDGRVSIDATVQPMRFEADARGRGMEVPLLFPDAEFAQGAQGRIGGRLELAGRGESVAEMLGSADGTVTLLMGRGRVRGADDDGGMDLASMVGFISDDDGWMTIRCAVADLDVDDGVMRARALAIDAEKTLIVGEGGIRLDDERWDLTLHPQPKQARFPSLRAPVKVQGPLDAPDLEAQKGPLLARGAVAALLYSVAPPAALLALVGSGGGEDVDCSGVVADAGDAGSNR